MSLEIEVTSEHIHRRMEERWGKRSTLKRAIDRVLQSMYEWKIICENRKGSIQIPSKVATNNKKLQLWLIETVLRSEGVDSMYIPKVLNSPSVFPFLINISRSDLQRSKIFEYIRQGVNYEILAIRHAN
jgi:hypothetical protein